jgi:dephospho-CoA kinase
MCGLGNIYADEVCFASSISPFLLGNKLSLDNVKAILENSKKILLKAIENNGSTVHSYKASQDVSGSFQNFLKVYSNEGKLCSKCKSVKIEKRRLGGRGTSLCVKCQHAGVNVAITGKIASGKSLVLSAFEKLGYKTFSADKEVALLYSDENFLKELKKKFPTVFTPELDKKVIAEKLISDKKFKREYETYIHSIIKTKVNEFIVKHDGLDKAFEIPLLFDAKMDKSFTFTIGVESNKQLEHLKIRGDKDAEKRLDFNNINSFDKNKHKLDYIIVNDFDKEELFDKVKEIDKDIKKKMREN